MTNIFRKESRETRIEIIFVLMELLSVLKIYGIERGTTFKVLDFGRISLWSLVIPNKNIQQFVLH